MNYSTIEGCIRQSNKDKIMTKTEEKKIFPVGPLEESEVGYPTIRVEKALSRAMGVNKFLIEQLEKIDAPQVRLAEAIADHLTEARKEFKIVVNEINYEYGEG